MAAGSAAGFPAWRWDACGDGGAIAPTPKSALRVTKGNGSADGVLADRPVG